MGARHEIDTKVSAPGGGPVQHVVQFDDLTTEQLKEKAHTIIKEMKWLEEDEVNDEFIPTWPIS